MVPFRPVLTIATAALVMIASAQGNNPKTKAEDKKETQEKSTVTQLASATTQTTPTIQGQTVNVTTPPINVTIPPKQDKTDLGEEFGKGLAGLVGAAIGAIAAFGGTWYTLHRQHKKDERTTQAAQHTAAAAIVVAMIGLMLDYQRTAIKLNTLYASWKKTKHLLGTPLPRNPNDIELWQLAKEIGARYNTVNEALNDTKAKLRAKAEEYGKPSISDQNVTHAYISKGVRVWLSESDPIIKSNIDEQAITDRIEDMISELRELREYEDKQAETILSGNKPSNQLPNLPLLGYPKE